MKMKVMISKVDRCLSLLEAKVLDPFCPPTFADDKLLKMKLIFSHTASSGVSKS